MIRLKHVIALFWMALVLPAALPAVGRGPIRGASLGAEPRLTPGTHTGRGGASLSAHATPAPRHRLAVPSWNLARDSKMAALAARSHAGPRQALASSFRALEASASSLIRCNSFLHSRLQAGWPLQWPIRPPPASQSIV